MDTQSQQQLLEELPLAHPVFLFSNPLSQVLAARAVQPPPQ
jgi:hypothetical protein